MILEQTKYRIGRLMNRASVPLFSPEGEKSTGQGEETEEEEEGGGSRPLKNGSRPSPSFPVCWNPFFHLPSFWTLP